MANTYRPFEALGTKWHSNVFFRARLKLTGLYLLVMLVVLTLFSVTLYFNISSDIRESLGHSLAQGIDPDHFFEDRDNHIFSVLLLVDGTILLVSGALGYLFAGYTLKPINTIMLAQERFTADAAHELRTPLAVIQAQIEVLLRGSEPIPKKVQTALASILDETKNLTGITKDLLHAARQDGIARHKKLGAVLISDVASDVIQNIQIMAQGKDIRIVKEMATGLAVYADQDGLRRVFTNILDNALKYTPEHGHIRISSAEEDQHTVTLSVTDDGSGIPAENLPYVFERFYKADNARQTLGTGLGLSIVQELVESFGGTITIQSHVGKGTEVTIRLKKVV